MYISSGRRLTDQATGGGPYQFSTFTAPSCSLDDYFLHTCHFLKSGYWSSYFDYKTFTNPLKISNINSDVVDIGVSDLYVQLDIVDGEYWYCASTDVSSGSTH